MSDTRQSGPRSVGRYLELAPSSIALFRFLLEPWGHLAQFTVLDSRRAVIKVLCAPGQEKRLDRALACVAEEVDFREIPAPKRAAD
ncbi:DUF4911 domain-containing protein [Desulfohalovibrio reitneri]|uniref:DUF4911 domain-containing protein n=1 Tax=Desulfohalovibrio reitneri TaxID=1307759 RepID=UPI00054F7ABD|nr:DUF4911 domain-containing protein [Desulfohalovibrio reitneri]